MCCTVADLRGREGRPPWAKIWGEGTVFSLSVHTSLGAGVIPLSCWRMGYPHPRSGQGGYPVVGHDGGTPILGQDGGYPHPRSGGGTPIPGQNGEYPPPSRSQIRTGVGYPNWNSIACTCYAVGSMPLAFKQEDFLAFMQFLEKIGQIVCWRCPPPPPFGLVPSPPRNPGSTTGTKSKWGPFRLLKINLGSNARTPWQHCFQSKMKFSKCAIKMFVRFCL